MNPTRKLWTRFGETLVVGGMLGASAALAAPSVEPSAPAPAPLPAALSMALAGAAAAQGEGEGEGEGASIAGPREDDIAFLVQLGLVRGHLMVGVALYEAGRPAMAASHMKHPGDELYTTLRPGMESRHAPDFADQLAALAAAVEKDAGLEEVRRAHAELEAALVRTQSVVDLDDQHGVMIVLGTVHGLVRTAAEEYELGVRDGAIVNGHEYQDAWGFTTVARRWVGGLAALDGEAGAAFARVATQLDGLLAAAWPSVVPPEAVDTRPSQLHAAAARIELEYRAFD